MTSRYKMGYMTTTTMLEGAHVLLLVIAAVLSMFAVRTFYSARHDSGIMLVKKRVFTMLSPAMVALVAGFAARFFVMRPGCGTMLSAAEPFFVISYTLMAAAFAYFWYEAMKLHRLHIKEPIFIFAVVCGVFIWNYFLFRTVLLPMVAGQHPLVSAVTFFCPVIVSIIFILTLIIHPLVKAGVIRTPLWYLSAGVFTHFLAFMVDYYYAFASSSHFLPPIAAALFVISAFNFCVGFETASNKYMR